jgi:hypothetical protein
MVLMVSLVALGCGGGGASSVPVEKDVVGITRTLNDFMAASRTNDQEKLQSVLAAPIEYYLMVKDFGEDITNPNDNKEYEFYVTSDLIDQPSSDLAHVYAYYMLHSGQPYWLYFRMVREDGRWVIEEMANKAPQAGGYVQPIVPTPPPTPPAADEFVAASYSKLDGGIRKIFALEDSFGKVLPLRMDTSYLSPYLENGITFYELYETYGDAINPDYEGFVPSATSRRSLASNIVNRVKRNLRGSRLSLRAQTEPEIFVHYGLDSEGAFWMRMVESTSMMIFNNGQPIKLFEKSHPFGTSRSLSYPYTVDGIPFKIDITINIGNPVTGFMTPLQGYAAVPLTFNTIDSEFGEGDKWVEYYALGIGEVGYDYFDTPTSAQPSEIERLLTRFNSDGSLNQRNDPVITNTDTFLGSYNVGDTITPMQVTSSGGVAPYEFRWHSDESKLYSMPPGVTLSRNGVISGTAPGSGAGETFYGKVEVVDKYFRHTYKEFSIESLVSEGGSVPPPASIFFATNAGAPASYYLFAGIDMNPDPSIPGYTLRNDGDASPLLFQTPPDGDSIPSDNVQVNPLSGTGWFWNSSWNPPIPRGPDGNSYILTVGPNFDLFLQNSDRSKFVRISVQIVNVTGKQPIDRSDNDLRLDVMSFSESFSDPIAVSRR